jgi:hypothetical protein
MGFKRSDELATPGTGGAIISKKFNPASKSLAAA